MGYPAQFDLILGGPLYPCVSTCTANLEFVLLKYPFKKMKNTNLKKFQQFVKCLDFLTIFQQIFRICTSHDDEVFKRNCVVVLEMLHDQLISSNNFIACEKDFHFLLEE